MYRGYALIAPMACTGAMWRMLRVGRILICVHTTNKDCLLLLLLLLLLRDGWIVIYDITNKDSLLLLLLLLLLLQVRQVRL